MTVKNITNNDMNTSPPSSRISRQPRRGWGLKKQYNGHQESRMYMEAVLGYHTNPWFGKDHDD